jgi:DEAD/DEAH box helicase domain-containing protein
MPSEIYLDIETQKLSHEVPGGWNNIRAFGVAVAVTLDEANQFRVWYEQDAQALIAELETFDRIITFNGERFDFTVLSGYGHVGKLYLKSMDVLADLVKKLSHRVKLDALVQATLGRGKTGTGDEAVKWWRAGEIDKVVEYCKQDVQLLADVVKFGRERGYVMIPPRRVVRVNWT